MKNNPIIIALDDPRHIDIAEDLGDLIDWYKVGAIPFLHYGRDIINSLKKMGKKIMLDLKFHDIPNTVGKACKEAKDMGVDMATIHLSGGSEMIESAVDSGLKILGVSILTSLKENDLDKIGFDSNFSVYDHAYDLSRLGILNGVYGIVCSANETKKLKNELNENHFNYNFKIVNPGIRLPEDNKDDQKRVATPDQAIKDGADYIVVGRSIIADPNPVEKCKKYIKLIEEVKK